LNCPDKYATTSEACTKLKASVRKCSTKINILSLLFANEEHENNPGDNLEANDE
jgi:hypothetical protein